jgi:hypothetical protein
MGKDWAAPIRRSVIRFSNQPRALSASRAVQPVERYCLRFALAFTLDVEMEQEQRHRTMAELRKYFFNSILQQCMLFSG